VQHVILESEVNFQSFVEKRLEDGPRRKSEDNIKTNSKETSLVLSGYGCRPLERFCEHGNELNLRVP
jgi:hypothetical protein